ncbi:hypothetical protein HU200_019656 [Digitaria exilis]|uniref:Uncharacterized protein n=1 Tax=Digitaria exilis TaxID=1010633 RepID=A0A835F2P3_9POAL|nr:hypothetical protein HU200_019656 [Digitaria exilis]
MAAELPEMAMVALSIAVGCAEILKPLLGFLGEASARNPVLDAAAAVLVVTLPTAYLAGVVLLYLHVAPAGAAAPVPPAALGRFVILVSALLLFMAFIFFIAVGVREQ